MALNFQPNYIDIYSNSWGPSDSGFIVGGPGTYTKKAMLKGIKEVSNSSMLFINYFPSVGIVMDHRIIEFYHVIIGQ